MVARSDEWSWCLAWRTVSPAQADLPAVQFTGLPRKIYGRIGYWKQLWWFSPVTLTLDDTDVISRTTHQPTRGRAALTGPMSAICATTSVLSRRVCCEEWSQGSCCKHRATTSHREQAQRAASVQKALYISSSTRWVSAAHLAADNNASW